MATDTKLNGDQAALARRMKANGETAATICETLGIGRTTLYRYLAESAED
ncbi:MAG: helix-turn-helix domain-containing protein [Mycobacterium sp.]|nr:helix-turn-helix domain-containing protein [Mycobacterium sp.]